MGKKRLSGITVIGVSEIILGLAGCVILLSAIGVYFANVFIGIEFGFSENSYNIMRLAIFLGIVTMPFAVILIAGIGTLNLRSWAHKLNIFVVPLVTLPVIFVWTIRAFSDSWAEAAVKVIPVGVLLMLNIKYLSRPQVTEQFIEEED